MPPPPPPPPTLTHTPNIPYTNPPTPLQTLDLWLPTTTPTPTTTPEPTQPTTPPLWLLYLHGGAWRDPTQPASTFHPTITHLLSSHPHLFTSPPSTTPAPRITALASLSYRLSPHPSHPSSSPSRNVTHPSHIHDVRAALRFLRREYGMRRCVGVGHSCGATLWAQVLGGIGVEDEDDDEQDEALQDTIQGLVLLAGIYDIPLLVANHGSPAETARVYRHIVTGAFGEHVQAWADASPVHARYRGGIGKGKIVYLAWSPGDELIEGAQREGMLGRLVEEGWVCEGEGDGEAEAEAADSKHRRRDRDRGRNTGVVALRDLHGAHDAAWRSGDQVADLIAEIVGRVGRG